MFVLWRHGAMAIQDLSRATGLGKSTLTSMLDRLEAAGHLKRSPDLDDRRQIIIAATGRSLEQMDRYVAVSKEMNEEFYHGFAPDEIDTFEGYLRRILTNLGASR